MSSKSIRYGVIGAGRVWQRYHLPCVRARADYTLVAICDRDLQFAHRVLQDHRDVKVLLTENLNEFFDRGQLDVVVVSTPNHAHVRPVVESVTRGIRVLCEKPLASTVDGARAIAAADAARGIVAMNLPYRFHPLLPAFAAALPDECVVTLRFLTPGQRLWRPVTSWYDDRKLSGGGALLDLGTHALDLLRAVLGPLTLKVATINSSDVEERTVVSMTARSGPVRVAIDRASHRMELSISATRGAEQVAALDLRRGRLRVGEHTESVSPSGLELAAIVRFLDAAAGDQSAEVVGAAETLISHELIHRAYHEAVVDRSLHF